jgi:hypothetical protein
MIADEQVKVFIDNESTNLTNVDVSAEDLEGTLLHTKDEPTEPTQSYDETDLDISSADRREWYEGTQNTPYNFAVVLGASETFPGISTMHIFKNVVAICVTHVILPDTITNTIDKYPYLYLEIDELTGIYHSTSEHGRRAMVKLIRDKQWSESPTSNVRYNLMNTKGNGAKASVGWKVKTPLGSLSKLSIRILTPSGAKIKNLQDIFEFIKLEETAGIIKITCKNNFDPNSIHVGNRIGFKISKESPTIEDTELIDFLENNEHEVVQVIGSEIHISCPIESYGPTGTPLYKDFSAGIIDNISPCYIMNFSVQSNFGFNVKTVCHDVVEVAKLV